MSQVAIQNYIGRDYTVPFVDDNELEPIVVTLKKGLNILAADVWDKIKTHPCIKALLDTPHKHCIARRKQVDGTADGSEKDSKFITTLDTYNVDGEKHRMLEVRDFRAVDTKPKTQKAE